MIKYDVVVIGAGLIGLSTAYMIAKSNPQKKILILEKEPTVSEHQSGNNSGVLHSGVYYKPGSLKASNCILGYELMVDFAIEHDIPLERCGKLIVASNNKERPGLKDIYHRGIANGLSDLKLMNAEEFKEIEPYVNGVEALFVPQAGIIDYSAVADKLFYLLLNNYSVETVFNSEVVALREFENGMAVVTKGKDYWTEKIISCAGLHSDRVTNMTNPINDLRIIPFRGEYYSLKKDKEHLVNNLIYPVPDPNFPFLGVHFTRLIGGGITAGPNAVLAFKREGYRFSSFSIMDVFDTLAWPGFWRIVGKYGGTGIGEIYRSLSKPAFTRALQKLVPDIHQDDLLPGGSGVRAQACDRKGKLIDDFNIIHGQNAIHVRNAPSPAATSCFAIARTISNEL